MMQIHSTETLYSQELFAATPPGYVTVNEAVMGLASMRDSPAVPRRSREAAQFAFEAGRAWVASRPPGGWTADYGRRRGMTFLFDDSDPTGFRIDIENIRGHNLRS